MNIFTKLILIIINSIPVWLINLVLCMTYLTSLFYILDDSSTYDKLVYLYIFICLLQYFVLNKLRIKAATIPACKWDTCIYRLYLCIRYDNDGWCLTTQATYRNYIHFGLLRTVDIKDPSRVAYRFLLGKLAIEWSIIQL